MRGAWVGLLAVGACGGNPCEAYVDAVIACYADAGVAAPGGVDVGTQCPDDTTAQSEDFYRCRAEVWADADCGTAEGLAAARAAEVACEVE